MKRKVLSVILTGAMVAGLAGTVTVHAEEQKTYNIGICQLVPVSYTHLDVYKRQRKYFVGHFIHNMDTSAVDVQHDVIAIVLITVNQTHVSISFHSFLLHE